MLKDTPRSRMWESCLSGSERGLGTTMAWLLESLSYSKFTLPELECLLAMEFGDFIEELYEKI